VAQLEVEGGSRDVDGSLAGVCRALRIDGSGEHIEAVGHIRAKHLGHPACLVTGPGGGHGGECRGDAVPRAGWRSVEDLGCARRQGVELGGWGPGERVDGYGEGDGQQLVLGDGLELAVAGGEDLVLGGAVMRCSSTSTAPWTEPPARDVSVQRLMYHHHVKRLQILIDEELDAALERRAAEEGASKAALIRRFVRERLQPLPPLSADPLYRMIGADDCEPAPVDDVVYP
jgi:hypothetical protein